MKLAVLSKSSLITPISGAKFPQNPQDQELMLGVREAIDRLRADCWTLAIASNQGGCDVFTVQASRIKVGDYLLHGNDRYLVEQINQHNDQIYFQYDRPRENGKSFSLAFPDLDVRVSYKTIESAIEECQFAADLLGIDQVYFCPLMSGDLAACCEKREDVWRYGEVLRPDVFGGFRKPHPGMLIAALSSLGNLQYQLTDRIMIGDRPEDEAAAIAAGFRFLDAEQWRNGASVEVV